MFGTGEDRLHADFRADGVAVRCGADATNLKPGVRVAVVPVKKIGPAPLPIGHEQIEKTVVVVIAPRAAGGIPAIVDDAAGGHFAERAVAVVVIESVVL